MVLIKCAKKYGFNSYGENVKDTIGESITKDNEEDYYYEDNSYEYESIYDNPYYDPYLDIDQ